MKNKIIAIISLLIISIIIIVLKEYFEFHQAFALAAICSVGYIVSTIEQKHRKSWLGNLNYFILQWFCIRLAKTVNKCGKITSWSILKWIKPLTGWDDDYIYLRGKK